MKIFIVMICMLLVTSCTPKYPLKINIDDYELGLEITNSVISTENLFENKCIEFDSSIPSTQILNRQEDGEALYTFQNRVLLKNYNLGNDCNTDNSIKITNIKSEYSWDGRMRLNFYASKISLESNYYCNDNTVKFYSIKERALKKHGKLITLGLINEEKTQAMIAAVIVLAFDDAISDIHNQIKIQCNQ